tara:strand:- start:115 stop:759 length:645 start_codon:yes stop_codon:yes gene_type:complete
MAGLIGKKIGMTSVFDEEGNNIPCTIVQAGPCYVTQVKDDKKDGYKAIQLGFEYKKIKNISKALQGHLKKSKIESKDDYSNTLMLSKLFEFNNFESDYNLGDELKVDIFEEGEFVDVSGISKGKGFQGVVKRHGFKGVGDATHGQHNRLRAPGSIGAASYPARVFKGMRMAGQMGNNKVKMSNLKVVKVLVENNILLIKGSVPGHNNTYLKIEK